MKSPSAPPPASTGCRPLTVTRAQIRSTRQRSIVPPPLPDAAPASISLCVGDVFHVPAALTTSGLQCWIICLPGRCEDDGTIPFCEASLDGSSRLSLLSPSPHGILARCTRVLFTGVPDLVADLLDDALSDPPQTGRIRPPGRRAASHSRTPVHPPLPLRSPALQPPSLPPTLHRLRPLLARHADVPTPSLASLARQNHLGPRRGLLPAHREPTAFRAWGMPTPAAPVCLIFSHAERAVRSWAQHPPGSPLPPLASLRPPVSVLSACFRSDGIVPTLATGGPEGRTWVGAEEVEDGADGVEVHSATDGLLGASGVGDAYSGEE